MTLQAKFFAFVAPVLLATAVLPPVLWFSLHANPVPAQVMCGAALLCAGLIMTALLTVYFAASLLVCRPMRRMAQQMNRISDGSDVKPLAESARSDELGLAARAFNQIVDSLQWATKAMQEANTDLERRVSERVAELAGRNTELALAEQKYRSIFENATEGIFQTSPQGRAVTANPAMVQMLGYDSEAELINSIKDLSTLVYADPAGRQKLLNLLSQTGRVENFEAQLVRRDGSPVWVSMSVRTICDESGNVLRIQKFIRDITQIKAEQQKQRESEAETRKLALLASKTHNPILITDPQGRLEWANAAFTELTGYTLGELIGRKPGSALQGPDTDPAVIQHMRECIVRGEPFRVEVLNYSRDGTRYWLSIDAEPIRDQAGKLEHYIAFEEDVTQRKRAEWMEQDRRTILEMIARDEPLPQTLEALCRAAERQWPEARGMVLLNDEDRREIATAPKLSAAFVLGIDALLTSHRGDESSQFGKTARFVPDLTTDPLWAGLHDAANTEGVVACSQTPILAGNGKTLGSLVLFYGNCVSVEDDDRQAMQSLAGLCGLAIQHHQLIARLEYDAVHDPLTGLANRAQLESQLPKWISAAARHERTLAVMMIDLDGFKTVNDTLGHRCGDMLLRQVAARLSDAIRESDVLVRMGGDEFTLVATELNSQGDVNAVADRLIEALTLPFVVEGRELFVSASIGMAVYPQDGMDDAGLQRCADSAMYAAKAAGRNRALRFDPGMGEATLDRLEMEGQLRHALERNEFLLEYQPQINRRGEIVGVEALVRWQHPHLGRIAPARFIPLAEKCGLVVSIGTWVLHEACRQAMAWQRSGCPPLLVAVNVSALQFQQEDFLDILKATLDITGLPASCLELELTETLLLANTADAIRKLKAVRDLGVGVAIDDFGTGYSSLAYLQKLPIDRLKIDQSFVRDMGTGPQITIDRSHTAVITAITSLAASLGMRVVAEGVETTAQRDYLIEIGCDTLQGFLFSRPVHADRIESMLRPRHEKCPALAGAA